jgi:hypothetical protein
MRRRFGALSTIMWSTHSRRIEPIRRSTYGFCPGARWSGDGLSDAYHSPAEGLACRCCRDPDAMSVPCRWEGLDDLLSRPRRRGMVRDIEMHDAPTAMRQRDQHKEDAAGECRHDEEFQRRGSGEMIGQERFLGLGVDDCPVEADATPCARRGQRRVSATRHESAVRPIRDSPSPSFK